MHPCRSRGCKNIKGQSWRSMKNLPVQPAPRTSGSRLAKLAIFFAISKFDLKHFCSLLTYKNVQYIIWKIWFISVWRLWAKVMPWLFTWFIFTQSTLVSYHTRPLLKQKLAALYNVLTSMIPFTYRITAAYTTVLDLKRLRLCSKKPTFFEFTTCSTM